MQKTMYDQVRWETSAKLFLGYILNQNTEILKYFEPSVNAKHDD